MANQKAENTKSLPNLNGVAFSVGDGVHWGFNGDAYPGTVRKVSTSGRKVWVSRDKHRGLNTENNKHLHEGPIDSVFVPTDMPESEWQCFTLRKHGHFCEAPGSRATWSLQPTRIFASNPSF